MKRIAIVIPCYNEEEALPITLPRLLDLLERLHREGLATKDSLLFCVDDGSTDKTWDIISNYHRHDPRVTGISLKQNCGHQRALFTGLIAAVKGADATVSIDADLQDDPEAIIEMVRQYAQGKEVVYGVRSSRDADSWWKRSSARTFYRLLKRLGMDIIYDHADFRLMSAKAVKRLAEMSGEGLYLRGLVPMLGLESTSVSYKRGPRIAGRSKYSFCKMMALSAQGVRLALRKNVGIAHKHSLQPFDVSKSLL